MAHAKHTTGNTRQTTSAHSGMTHPSRTQYAIRAHTKADSQQRVHRQTTLTLPTRTQRTRARANVTGQGSIKGAIVMLLCAITLVCTSALFGELHTRHTKTLIAQQPLETVFVCEGDTMWHIAQEHTVVGVETDELVTWLYEHNNLVGTSLRPGQRLEAPKPTE